MSQVFRRALSGAFLPAAGVAVVALACACGDLAKTYAVVDNRYPDSVVVAASWQGIAFDGPIAPGTSSDAQTALASSDNPAYALITSRDNGSTTDGGVDARDPGYVVLQSKGGFAVHLNNTAHITVDDDDFAGNCAAGSTLTQAQVDFIAHYVFPDALARIHYDAATCVSTFLPEVDASAP